MTCRMIVLYQNPLNNTVWHTWIIQTVNQDWSITVLEANREWKTTWWPLVENTYSAEQVRNMKFSKNPWIQWTEYKTDSIPQYTNYLTSWKIGTNKDELAAIVKEFWSVENFKAQAEQYNNSENWPRQKELDKNYKIKKTSRKYCI